jgi:hypothetical protein
VEPVLPLSLVLSVVGGAASAFLTLGRKFESINERHLEHIRTVDQRMDAIELRLAKDYVDKEDLGMILKRLDDRIDRMDYKLDQILIGYNKNAK